MATGKSKAALTKDGTGAAGTEVEYTDALAASANIFTTSTSMSDTVNVDERGAIATCAVAVDPSTFPENKKATNIALEVDLATLPIRTAIGKMGGPFHPGQYDKDDPDSTNGIKTWITIPCNPSTMAHPSAVSSYEASGEVKMDIKAGVFAAWATNGWGGSDPSDFPEAKIDNATITARLTYDLSLLDPEEKTGTQEAESIPLVVAD